ncbi:hypothetical protein CTEN210_02721 [Chaetoceros tenuissimus]|uniref:Ankyrin repeat protein n=1 Tax=Chaetoceros tenuissimus TaxID=426638 RepID=A0AAD3H0L4_9STRA|nr:hypothetical protein CTEN210_02721 [Chaetoceros tenuissimus]
MAVILESGRKRARTEEAPTSTDSSSGNSYRDERVTQILNSLSDLSNEFPEIKLIIDFENLQANVETAVEKYAKDLETKNRKDIILTNYGQGKVPLYSLPDEVLSNCLAYVGKGYYGSVALTSKKLYEAYKKEFGNKTAYLEMATSVNLANYCLSELCTNLQEKDEFLKAAAVNGNIDVLRCAVSSGYDLFPLVAMNYRSYDTYKGRVEKYIANEDSANNIVKSFKLVQRGHLHVLKYLHEKLNHNLGLQRYCKPAVQYGQLEILQWLQSIGYLGNAPLHTEADYCNYAIKMGNVEVLQWLLQNGYEIKAPMFSIHGSILADAIRSKSVEMIRYCYSLGYNDLLQHSIEEAIIEARNKEVFRVMHDLGYDFGWIDERWCTACADYNFEIIKFLRSISVPWYDDFMKEIVKFGTLEMIKYAHEDGCPWTTCPIGVEYSILLNTSRWSIEKFEYIKDNGCSFDYDESRDYMLQYSLIQKKNFKVLDHFIGKNHEFDNEIFIKMLKREPWNEGLEDNEPWFEGISHLLENSKHVENFKSLEEVFHERQNIDGIKYFHSLGLPWCVESSRNTQLLSKLACYNGLDDVKWAYENGCIGGDLVPYIDEEWDSDEIRQRDEWTANQAFFEKNGLLSQEFKDALSESEHLFFRIDLTSLENLVEDGYTFCSPSEKKSVTKEAFNKCCQHPYSNKDYRKRFIIIQRIGIKQL